MCSDENITMHLATTNNGIAEFAGLEFWKMTDEIAGVEFAGLENDGLEMTE